MTSTTFTPVTASERIQTIDIIRGFALLGIIIINFTVDTGGTTPEDGWRSIGDQTIFWAVKFFIDDRFQTIYCFLFGLGFAIQMQRASERNSPFVFKFLRRMLALFLIGSALHIFFTWSYSVLPFYAIIGILLLLFWEVPVKFLPVLAIFFFLLPVTRNTIVKLNEKKEIVTDIKKNVVVDTTLLDKYAGVYQVAENINVIFFRNKDSLVGESPTNHFYLEPLSDSQFFRKERNYHYTFIKSSSGEVEKVNVVYVPTSFSRVYTRIPGDLQVALKKQLEQRPALLKESTAAKSYKKHVKDNFDLLWNYLKTFPWQNFLWKGEYEVGYILVLFLLGLYAGKKQIFQNVAVNKKFLKKVFNWGLIIGTPLLVFTIAYQMWYSFQGINYWDKLTALTHTLYSTTWNIAIISLAMAYIAGLTLLLENDNWKKRLGFFGTVGRLGLTNYSLHLLAYLLIFENVNLFLRLNGKVGHVYRLPIALLVYALLYLFSRWWLRHFKIGPFEWLWRSITYWKWQPLRRSATN